MRGAGDPLSIGERVAFYRRRRGLAQVALAGMVGRSEDWLSKIERGERDIRRLDLLVELARALRVGLGDLLGQPVLMEDENAQDAVSEIRNALMAPDRLSRTLFGSNAHELPVDPEQAHRWTENAFIAYQRGAMSQAIAGLPKLLFLAQRLETEERSGQPGRRGMAVSSRVHHLAFSVLAKLGESDLAWLAAERAMRAADHADAPAPLASAARAGVHALLLMGRFDDALKLGETASRWLSPRIREGDALALTLAGMLDLRCAVAAGRRRDHRTAYELLARATDSGNALGRDANLWQTGFGPTNVELHRLSIALELGEVSKVVDQGPAVNTASLPLERQVTHLLDLGRAFVVARRDDDAIATLLAAEERSAQLVRHSASARETVRILYRRAPASARTRSSTLLRLAERCRAVSDA